MFLIIPLFIIFVSVLAIAYIVWRKVPYLKKLSPEEYPSNSEFLLDFIPELATRYGRGQAKQYKDDLLLEVEKFLRRMRLFFLKIDSISDALIKKIRRSHLGQLPKEVMSIEATPVVLADELSKTRVRKSRQLSEEELKKEEQNLIIEIARNPKDAKLYVALGDIYVKMDNLQDAKEALEAALKLDQANEQVKRKIERISNRLNPAI